MQVFTNIQPDTIKIFSRPSRKFRKQRTTISTESIFEQVLFHSHKVELTPNFQNTKCSKCNNNAAISFCRKCTGFHCVNCLDSDCPFVTEDLL